MADPLLRYVPITIAGKDYKLCFDNNAIADVEEKLIAAGYNVNLLAAKIGPLNFSSVRAMFIASLAVYQPEIGAAEARELFAQADVVEVGILVNEGYRGFLADPEDAPVVDPPKVTEGEPAI